MHSFLIISNNEEKRKLEAEKLSLQEQVTPFDVTFVQRKEVSTKDELKLKASLGIDDIKEMQKTLYLKPFQGEKKAIIFHDAHLLTIEAQNALLKSLEEPPRATIFILTAEMKEALLPTILSRCQVIDLGNDAIQVAPHERKQIELIVAALEEGSLGKSLKQAEKLAKNKDEALVFLEKVVITVREQMLAATATRNKKSIWYAHFLEKVERTRKQIKATNVNLRLTLENLFLNSLG